MAASNKNDLSSEMVLEKSWNEFQKTGLFWFINSLLHVFGWALVYEFDGKIGADGFNISRVYPARVRYRGFSPDVQAEAHKMIAQYVEQNAQDLREETEL